MVPVFFNRVEVRGSFRKIYDPNVLILMQQGSVKLRRYGIRRVSGKVGGRTSCEISTAAGAMLLPVVDPQANHGWQYGIRYR